MRSVGKKQVQRSLRRESFVCRKCGSRLAGLERQKLIEQSPDCLVLDPAYKKDIKWGLYSALVKCPDCGKVFEKKRQSLLKDRHTICYSCISRRDALVLESNENCIILQQFIKGTFRALVQCPDCGATFEKARNEIVRANHTFCRKCAHHGPRHWRWQGGKERYYGPHWAKIAAKIRERDGHRCQYLGCNESSFSIGRNIDVHHIVPFFDYPDAESANAERNLICLCRDHHRWADENLEESIPLLDDIIRAIYDYVRPSTKTN